MEHLTNDLECPKHGQTIVVEEGNARCQVHNCVYLAGPANFHRPTIWEWDQIDDISWLARNLELASRYLRQSQEIDPAEEAAMDIVRKRLEIIAARRILKEKGVTDARV